MVRVWTTGSLLLLGAAMAGCGTTGVSMNHRDRAMTHDCRQLIEQQGGIDDDQALRADVQRVVDRLLEMHGLRGHPVRTCILDRDDPRAYAWSNGWVIVSRGLAGAEQALLAAAVAHELGHLIADGHLTLHDDSRLAAIVAEADALGTDSEVAADQIGMALLEHAGYDPDAMCRLLERLSTDPALPPMVLDQIDMRIAAYTIDNR